MKNKNIAISIVLFSYVLTIQPIDLLARSSRSTSSRSKASSRSSSKSTRTSIIPAATTITTTEVQETTATPVATTEVVTEAVASVATETAEVAEVAPVEAVVEEEKDISADPEWENFRICMQQNCSGGDDQPNNVQCYRSVVFDNVFMNCSSLITSSKKEDFKTYFNGPFVLNEKREFCQGEYYKGTFDENTKTCNLNVRYNRVKVDSKVKNSGNGCSASNVTRVWSISNRNYICEGESFGVSPCYQDSANVDAAQIQKVTGGISLGLGVVSAALPAVLTAVKTTKVSVNKPTTDADGNTSYQSVQMTQDEYIDYKSEGKGMGEIPGVFSKAEDTFKSQKTSDVLGSVSTGLAAGGGLITSGTTQLVSASMMEKEKGARVYGRCILPNGEVIPEGQGIKLNW